MKTFCVFYRDKIAEVNADTWEMNSGCNCVRFYENNESGRKTVAVFSMNTIAGFIDKSPYDTYTGEMIECISKEQAIEALDVELNFSLKSSIDFSQYKKEVQEILDNILQAQEKAIRALPSFKVDGGKG